MRTSRLTKGLLPASVAAVVLANALGRGPTSRIMRFDLTGPAADDSAIPSALDTWKDTLDLAPNQQAAVLVRFTDYSGRFLLHCHNLEHEDMAMSTFTVT